jgi:ABC-type antimicrobial peptide transport system permease subunit
MSFVPVGYNVRSLLVRRASTLLAVFGIAATVAVLAGLISLQQGFATLFASGGRDDLAVVLRQGATSEGESAFSRTDVDLLVKETAEFAVGADGRPLASGEMYLAVRRRKLDGGETNVPIRGVQPRTFDIHGSDLRLAEGRRFEPGTDEVIVGRALADRIRDCGVGDVLVLNTTPFRVVGVFEGRGAFESEIWGDVDRLMEALERPMLNRVIGVLRPEADVEALSARLDSDRRVPSQAMTERAYLEGQTVGLSALFIGLGSFLALIMGIGAVFTGTNSMLSALAARTHEIGILLSVGFRPWAIFASFLLESVLLGLLGGLVGCLLVLPLQGLRTGTMNMQTFTEVAFAFRVTPTVLVTAVLFALALGLLGGALPAWRASRLTPTEALRRG